MNAGAIAAGRVSSELARGVAFALLGSLAACGGRVLIDDAPSGGGFTSAPVAGAGAVSPAACPPNSRYCETRGECLANARPCPSVGTGGPPIAGGLDASTPDGSPPDASTPDASTPDASTPDASTPDASTPDGSAPDASTPDGSAPDMSMSLRSTPKRISCGDSLCSIDARCCLSRADESEQSRTLTSCSRSFCSMRRECDESADCASGQVCCYSVVSSPPSVIGSYCEPPENCRGDLESWIACGKPEDCSNAGAPACVAQKCAGTTLQACGEIPRAACRKTDG